MVKEIDLIPYLDACDFPCEVEEELSEKEISTHYQSDVIGIYNWNDEPYPELQKWLVATYGEGIKNYRSFAIAAT